MSTPRVLRTTTRTAEGRRRSDEGVALIITLMSMAVMMALGSALVLTTVVETTVAAYHRDGIEGRYAAEAVMERALVELARTPDWDAALAGGVSSGLTDGMPTGRRALTDGTYVDLDAESNLRRCGNIQPCALGEIASRTIERPFGENNPHWRMFAYGPIATFYGTAETSLPLYALVWVGDDPAETDGNPLRDAASAEMPGHDALMLRAHVYGARGVHRAVAAVVERARDADGVPVAGLRVLAWYNDP